MRRRTPLRGALCELAAQTRRKCFVGRGFSHDEERRGGALAACAAHFPRVFVFDLLRADAKRALPGADPRLRQLESEREQLTTHVRALAELLSVDVEADAAPDPAGVVANGAADGLATLRARAVRDANEQAEHELGRLRATTPR